MNSKMLEAFPPPQTLCTGKIELPKHEITPEMQEARENMGRYIEWEGWHECENSK